MDLQRCWSVVRVGMVSVATVRCCDGARPVVCNFECDITKQYCHLWAGPGKEGRRGDFDGCIK